MHTRPLLPLVATSALALLLAGCNSGSTGPAAVGDATPSATSVPSNSAVVTTPATSAAPASPSPARSPAAVLPARPAPPSYDVKLVERQLTEQRYYIGAIDGAPGDTLRSAVMAFQKVNGLSIDGDVGSATLAALNAPRAPGLKGSSPANRVEVDLTRQVLYVVKGGRLVRILPVSSGNGATYFQKDGSRATSLTPVGYYTIQRRYYGAQKADLGTLYDPQYFYQGWAIHGSNSVPAGPASHGCIRVTRPDATWLLGQLNVGMSVYVYGGTYTFTAGSSAPGTSNPTGDTPTVPPTRPPSASAVPSRAPAPSPSASRSPSGSPAPSKSASPSPTKS